MGMTHIHYHYSMSARLATVCVIDYITDHRCDGRCDADAEANSHSSLMATTTGVISRR